MKVVNISELKNRLSHYLQAVRRGEPLLVADRDRIIARIEPVAGAEPGLGDDAFRLDELERRGTIRRARTRLDADWLRRRPQATEDVVAALIEERTDGR